jgi:hypothetical protein
MQVKTTTKLFKSKYQYKIVLAIAGASWFRSGDFFEKISKLSISSNGGVNTVRDQEDLDYALLLASTLQKIPDIDIRVEAPWITVYTNDRKQIDKLIKLDKNKVKYISQPSANTTLAENTIVMPKMDYDYRITLGRTLHPNPAFVEWAETSPKCKLTKSCIRDLGKQRSWGGTHCYVTGDNNLLIVKMHLGESISKIERIVKS